MKAYLSHPISTDSEGNKVSDQQMNLNIKAALCYADMLRGLGFNVYCPAEEEEFVNRAYKKGFMSVDQILEVDCEILQSCDLIIAYNHQGISHGMSVEIAHAMKNNIPVLYIFRS